MATVLFASAALAQNRGSVTVVANVRPSILFSGTTPAGATFAQGGDQSASVTITALPGAQSLSTRAVVANNPSSTGYELVAKLASAGNVRLDGVELSTTETVIASQTAYGVAQTHTIVVRGPEAVTIILVCRPSR